MFMNDVNKKEEIRNIALKHLRKYGIKHRGKICRQPLQVAKTRKLFKVPLANLENETVTLKNGQQLVIPKRLFEMCSYILSKVETEGVFRKEGSKSRQNEIKLSLDRGCVLGVEHHVIDVAVVVKCFFRELPEPLIPYTFHELFLRCFLIENKIEALLLACLLLPTEHLNVLAYFMQFLNEVASYAKYNKMNSYNISVLVGPNVFPVTEKIAPKNKLMLKKTCDIIKLMIDNSKNIGVIPDYIIEQIGHDKTRELQVANKTKRRRSGSLTRIFNGLRKIVGNRNDDVDINSVNTVTPDLLLTPYNKTDKPKIETTNKRTLLERRWSALTSATNLRKKKRNSFTYRPNNDNSPMSDYVRVPKTEYEEIKSRVTAIEKRLSFELENVQSTVVHNEVNIIHDIQTAYEQTLTQAESLSPGTDQIARRLSRELKIRNSEEKLIRSPSARKIGNIRRRSRELEKPSKHSLQYNMNDFKPSLMRSVSSPIHNNIMLQTNVSVPFNLNSNMQVLLKTPKSSSFRTLDSSPSILLKSDQSNSGGHQSRSRERKVLKRSANVSSGRRQRYCNVEGLCLLEIKANKENSSDMLSPKSIPHIKKPLPVMRTPKRFCNTPKSGKIQTPLRVLPNAQLNISDL